MLQGCLVFWAKVVLLLLLPLAPPAPPFPLPPSILLSLLLLLLLTASICTALAVLELALLTRLALNFQIHLPMFLEYWD